jgi:hypothetical protein
LPLPAGARRQINPRVAAFNVAAARVEHSSLRNTRSTCVRTVRGLMPSARATSLVFSPLLMQRRTSSSRSDKACSPRCLRAAGLEGACDIAHGEQRIDNVLIEAPRLDVLLHAVQRLASLNSARHGRRVRRETHRSAAATNCASGGIAVPDRPRK